MMAFLFSPLGRWLAGIEAAALMDRLRAYPAGGEPVFQSYHADRPAPVVAES